MVKPLIWLSEEALHDVLLQGTGVVKIDDEIRYFNVHRNNGIAYDYAIGKREQPRYWYFIEVPSIMGYGEKQENKIAIKPQVTFAGNVKQLGLGKLFMVSYERNNEIISRLGVLADQGGAFDNNLFQLDMLVDSYSGWKDYQNSAAVCGIKLPEGLQPPVVQIKVDYKSASAPIIDQEVTQVIEKVIGGIEGVKNINSTSENGSSSISVESDVTTVLEEQLNGLQGMIYMDSTSSSDGSSNINLYFKTGYDLDIAAIDVQNRVALAIPSLPASVKQQGVVTKKKSSSMIQILTIQSSNDEHDSLFLSNFASINIVEELKRIQGVGDVSNLGEKKYSMRIWLNPNKLSQLGITIPEVTQAIREQNIDSALGSIGKSPMPAELGRTKKRGRNNNLR